MPDKRDMQPIVFNTCLYEWSGVAKPDVGINRQFQTDLDKNCHVKVSENFTAIRP